LIIIFFVPNTVTIDNINGTINARAIDDMRRLRINHHLRIIKALIRPCPFEQMLNPKDPAVIIFL
jgi:hypothetical protein